MNKYLLIAALLMCTMTDAKLCRRRHRHSPTSSTSEVESTTSTLNEVETTTGSSEIPTTSSTTPTSPTSTPTSTTTSTTSTTPTTVPSDQQGAIDVEQELSAGAISGKASYYTFWNQSAGFCGHIATGPYIVAMSPGLVQCGKCVLVEHGGKRLKAEITDQCAGCEATKIDLSDRAFEYLAPLEKGIIDVRWEIIDC